MNVRSSKPTALCRGSANALASPCASVKAILTAYSRAQGEVLYALEARPIVELDSGTPRYIAALHGAPRNGM